MSSNRHNTIDHDNPEWMKADFDRAMKVEGMTLSQATTALRTARGRPVMTPEDKKKPVSLRLSPDVIAALKSTGANWQTRANEALRKAFVG